MYQRTTQDLLQKMNKQNPELYNQIMEMREKYSDIIYLTRKQAKELQQKTLNEMLKVDHLKRRVIGPEFPSKTLYYIR
jgi:hypothetical protein